MAPESEPPAIKVCGLMTLTDAMFSADAGAGYLGFNFTRTSKRRLTLDAAKSWWGELPAQITRVALFQDQTAREVDEVLQALPIDILQFHGAESGEFCRRFSVPYWKAIAIEDQASFCRGARDHKHAGALLLDTAVLTAQGRSTSGGSGRAFDWSLWPDQATQPLVLAGGLSPQNVAEAIRQTRPWAVDVSSGVESAPGVKSRDKVQQFCHEVHSV